MSRLVVAVAIAAIAACSRDPGAPRVRPMPKPDAVPALRNSSKPKSDRLASYKIDARLDPQAHQITASETLTWTNSGETAVDRLPFHLFLNAFKNEATLFMRTSHGAIRGAKSTENWGWIQIDSVQIGGAELVGTLVRSTDPDETVVELPLAEPIAPKATVEISFKFTAQLPEVFARTGYKGDFHLIGQWFPKIGVRVGPPGVERWECQPFHAFTEFFADFGTYDVQLTVPNTFVVAATGVLTAAEEIPGGTRKWTYHADDVHDFVWMADPFMEMISGQAHVEDGPPVEVRVLYRPEQKEFAQRHLEAAIGAVTKFSAALVPYPWSVMTVVDPPVDAWMAAGGMEYPTLVTTGGDTVFARPGIRLPEFVTVHEIGHNWFQGMLASNEPVEAWLDEGVNEWADTHVMNDLYGARASGIDWMGWQAEYGALSRAAESDPDSIPTPIATAASSFVDFKAYGEATYASTMRALTTLEHVVGTPRFAAAIKVYAKNFQFKHPTSADLFDTLTKQLDQDLTWFFEPVFHQVGGYRVSVRSANCRPAHRARGLIGSGSQRTLVTAVEAPDSGFECEVVIQNTGTIHLPIEIELRFADGSAQRVKWDDRGDKHWERFVVQRSSPLAEVWIDPEDKTWMDSPLHHHYRIEGDGDASLRAAAWFSSTAQLLMGAIGP